MVVNPVGENHALVGVLILVQRKAQKWSDFWGCRVIFVIFMNFTEAYHCDYRSVGTARQNAHAP